MPIETTFLIVTNKELSASSGVALASMYQPGTLDYPNPQSGQFLPLTNIYVLSIEDFERLISGVSTMEWTLPSFLDACVEADQQAETSVHFFEQHLDRLKIPRKYSELVSNALDETAIRLRKAFDVGSLN